MNVLIATPDLTFCKQLARRLMAIDSHARIQTVSSVAQLLDLAVEQAYDVVLTTEILDDGTALEALPFFNRSLGDPPIVVIGASLRESLRAGASDALTREEALDPPVIGKTIETLVEQDRTQRHTIENRETESLVKLAGGIAHDFNNQLAVVLGNASLLLDMVEASNEEALLARSIIEAGENMADLAKQLLLFAHGSRVRPRRRDLNIMAQEAAKMLKVEQPQIEVALDLESALPGIDLDRSQILHLITALGRNALESQPRPGIISIRTSRVFRDAWTSSLTGAHPEGTYVQLEIAARGSGIPESVQETACDPGISMKTGRLGLGLSSTLGIVRDHGAALSLQTKRGLGRRVKVLFSIPSMSKPRREMARHRILLVDDSAAVRTSLATILGRSGYDVLEAMDGRTAVDLISTSREIDLVILDVQLPDSTGNELFGKVATIQPNTPIVMTSGYPDSILSPEVRERPQFAGFLQKPYHPGELLETIRRLLERVAPPARTTSA